MRIGFLTLEDRTGYVIDDAIVIKEMTDRGTEVVEVPWTRADLNAHDFDALIVRTTWDYQKDLPRFLTVLEELEDSGVPLANSLSLMRWNAEKTYLKELEVQGVKIVPTLWGEDLSIQTLRALPKKLGGGQFIIKPTISANADDTYWLDTSVLGADQIAARFANRAWMAQPFIQSVLDKGEISLFYFGGAYSHAVNKKPKSGDFRVQEEHGGLITSIVADKAMRTAGDLVMKALGETPLQARVDLVTMDDGSLALMELEAIEPSLYFRTDPRAAANFADAVERWLHFSL